MNKMEKKPNRLINEKSPYLLQHAYNPVDWYSWNEEAFNRARKENKPVFLSIGYSTCHWCHVMAHESFENEEVAKLMNKTFINIKVDREERPDLDHIYMAVCQMMTGSGGWPLSVIMTPDKVPFFVGTYIPRTSRFGRVGMIEIIPRIEEVWNNRYDEVLESAKKIRNALKSIDDIKTGPEMDEDLLDKTFNELIDRFDDEYGGFGNAPKFPTPHNFTFLLRYWKRTGKEKALQMVEKGLTEMRKGGIYDHIGYGFHRYSTDREWLVPHFEKMLYDQALLAISYLEIYQATGNSNYKDTAEEIFTYVLRDMTSKEGGFYSAEDADSEGVEGKFYVWKEEELREILKGDEADLVINIFNVKSNGNYKDEAIGEISGTNILHLKESLSELAERFKMSVTELENRISSARETLFRHREKRVHPHKDDKILTDWNGLMITALAMGARILGKKEYADESIKAVDFIMNSMRDSKGRLLHRYREGTSGIQGNLDDYAFFIQGLIEVYEATFNVKYLKIALDLNQDMIAHFIDGTRGGFFFTPDDGETLLVRKREIYDGAVPSGNSVAMMNMLRLARITGESELEEKAEETGRAFSSTVQQMPSAYTQLMTALDFAIGPSHEVVIAGDPESEDTRQMIKALGNIYLPGSVTVLRPTSDNPPQIDGLAEYIRHHVSIDNRATAYVCVNNACEAPITSVEKMIELLKG
jgi:uncharacterized protein YyaL (SSP411 family)